MLGVDDNYVERRAAERFLVSLPVETDRGVAVTRDISVVGLYLVTTDTVAAGDHLELAVNVPDPNCTDTPSPLRVILRGVVVRVEEAVGCTGAGVALRDGTKYFTEAS